MVNHFLIIQFFPDHRSQASPRYLQGYQNFIPQSNFLSRNYKGEILMALVEIKPPNHKTSGQVAILPSRMHDLMIEELS